MDVIMVLAAIGFTIGMMGIGGIALTWALGVQLPSKLNLAKVAVALVGFSLGFAGGGYVIWKLLGGFGP